GAGSSGYEASPVGSGAGVVEPGISVGSGVSGVVVSVGSGGGDSSVGASSGELGSSGGSGVSSEIVTEHSANSWTTPCQTVNANVAVVPLYGTTTCEEASTR